jgi:hypothetical protein
MTIALAIILLCQVVLVLESDTTPGGQVNLHMERRDGVPFVNVLCYCILSALTTRLKGRA